MQLGTKPNTSLQEFIISDRQWPRHLRIEHAKANIKAAKDPLARHFWEEVLLANT
jgi:hypothetical protein